ncbi:hypothetical protein M6B38_391205 [Iris pallida]|uniref:Uncharacterized protein n=1 Tax=Iris pallida TaxID=29817 RepID=A0AAX6FZA1_IRIPA|nr:hypothetical protein M6B38_391205 [Iris pallida]
MFGDGLEVRGGQFEFVKQWDVYSLLINFVLILFLDFINWFV